MPLILQMQLQNQIKKSRSVTFNVNMNFFRKNDHISILLKMPLSIRGNFTLVWKIAW